MALLDLYKLVVRDLNGKVIQIHEVYRNDIHRVMIAELEKRGDFCSVSVTKLSK
jgi:hypothetical protein